MAGKFPDRYMSGKYRLQAQNTNQANAMYEECVCRDTPSIGIITNSGLISHHNLGHYLL